MKRHVVRLLGALFAAFALVVSPASAQNNWPGKPITFIVPFPPGGSTDMFGRLIANELSKSLKQNVLVENRGGANGTIGAAFVANAEPDGYTILVSGVGSNAISHGLYPKLRYDSNKDFVHITQIAFGPNVLVASANAPFKTLKEFVAYAKANPGKVSYGSSGSGSSGHLSMEMFKQAVGVDVTHVPYKGVAPALQDLVAGQVSVLFGNHDAAAPFVKSGRLIAFAIAGTERNRLYPDIPTLAETGVANFSATTWFGLSAPKGTPQPVVQRMHAEVSKVLNNPAIKSKLEEQGFNVVASTPAQFSEFVRSETERWGKVIKTADVRID